MKVYTISRVQYLPINISEAWAFFSSAGNLSKITPTEMNFNVLTDLPDAQIYTGMRIDYKVSPLFRIPLRWRTEITNVVPLATFTDRQEVGPYKLWEHTHYFEEVSGGVKMTDEVRYALPFGIFGVWVHFAFVKRKLAKIFDYRYRKLQELFGEYKLA